MPPPLSSASVLFFKQRRPQSRCLLLDDALPDLASACSPLLVRSKVPIVDHTSMLIGSTVPLYQSETAPKWIRGAVVGAYQLAITIGLLIAAVVDNATEKRNDTGSYRIPIAVQFAWAIVLFCGMLFLPETPRFCIKQKQYDRAARALSRLRQLEQDHPAVVEELSEIQANHEYELSLGKATYLDCFKGNLAMRLITGCLLQSLQQLTGVNFVFYYGTSYFKSAGFQDAFVITMITSAVNVASTFPGKFHR